MANLTETSTYDAAVYQIETTDPVLGGPGGIANTQAQALANRTKYLKALADALGSGKQPLDATLTALAALVTAANKMIYSTGADTFALADLTAFARTLLDDADASTALSTLGVSAFIKTLIDDADAATARGTLGAAPLASPTFTGTPAAPTATAGTNTTQLATTAFVKAAADALLASPALSGNPTAPTPSQFDDDTSIATTAFVQRSLGNRCGADGLSSGATLTAGHAGKLIQVGSAGGYTITLPLLSTLPSGATIEFVSSAAALVTIQRQGTDNIHPLMGAPISSFTLANGDTATLVNANGVWGLVGGTATLGYARRFDCRAWVNFNGTGTVEIRASGNVSSITDNGTGDYTVNFTTAMVDANYGVALAGKLDESGISGNSVVEIRRIAGSVATASIRLNTFAASSGLVYDSHTVTTQIFR